MAMIKIGVLKSISDIYLKANSSALRLVRNSLDKE